MCVLSVTHFRTYLGATSVSLVPGASELQMKPVRAFDGQHFWNSGTIQASSARLDSNRKQHHIYPQGIFPEKDSEVIKSSSMGDGWGLKLPLHMQRRNHFIPLFCLKNWDSFFISESTIIVLFLSISFVLLRKPASRSRRSRDWKESILRGVRRVGSKIRQVWPVYTLAY